MHNEGKNNIRFIDNNELVVSGWWIYWCLVGPDKEMVFFFHDFSESEFTKCLYF